jgi:hypothetical protein
VTESGSSAANIGSRTYSDFETISDAMNGICQLYEAKLKQQNPGDTPVPRDPTMPQTPCAPRPGCGDWSVWFHCAQNLLSTLTRDTPLPTKADCMMRQA